MVTEFLEKLSYHTLLLVPVHSRGRALEKGHAFVEPGAGGAVHAGTWHGESHVLQEQKAGEAADVAGARHQRMHAFTAHLKSTAEQ